MACPIGGIVVLPTTATMCFIMYHVLMLCLIVFEVNALKCRSDGGPKEAELKNIYKKCLKTQDSNNSSKASSDQDWKETRGQNFKNNWERSRTGNKEQNSRDERTRRDRGSGNIDDMMTRFDDRMSGYDDRMSSYDDRMGSPYDRMGSNYDRMGGNNDRMSNNYDRTGSSRDRMGSNSDRVGSRNRMGGRNDRNNMGRDRDDRNERNDQFNGREDFDESGVYEYSPRRYKRAKKPENSGQRSQYNPNTQKITGYENNFRSDEKNSSDNSSSKDTDNKACALHCFMENLEMTGEDGMPDRYLVTHAITKDVKNEDLRDFLQESIEECFQIIDNENTKDKCEFSKNLLMCLSEKGKANCDDWRDDLKF